MYDSKLSTSMSPEDLRTLGWSWEWSQVGKLWKCQWVGNSLTVVS